MASRDSCSVDDSLCCGVVVKGSIEVSLVYKAQILTFSTCIR